MPASKDSKFRAKMARQAREAKAESYAVERDNAQPRVSGMGAHYSVLYTGRTSNVDADEVQAGLDARTPMRNIKGDRP